MGDGLQWSGMPPPPPPPQPERFRPLTLADVLDGMFRLFLAHWRAYAVALGIILVPLHFVLAVLGERLGTNIGVLEQFNDPAVAEAALTRGPALWALAGVGIVALVSLIFVQPLLLGVACTIAAEGFEGRQPEAGSAMRATLRRYWTLLGLMLLLGLIAIGVFAVPTGFVVLAAINSEGGTIALAVITFLAALLVGIWLFTRFALSFAVVVVERVGPATALRRSYRLVKGRWWRVFGTLLLAAIVSGIVAQIASFPFQLPGAMFGAWAGVVFVTIGGVIAEVITTPLSANAQTLLYFDGRIRSEGYDLEALTAGVVGTTGAAGEVPQPPYGGDPTSQSPYGGDPSAQPPYPPPDPERPFG